MGEWQAKISKNNAHAENPEAFMDPQLRENFHEMDARTDNFWDIQQYSVDLMLFVGTLEHTDRTTWSPQAPFLAFHKVLHYVVAAALKQPLEIPVIPSANTSRGSSFGGKPS